MDVNSEHLKNLLVENRKLLDALDKHYVQYSGYYKNQKEMSYELVNKLYKLVSDYRKKT